METDTEKFDDKDFKGNDGIDLYNPGVIEKQDVGEVFKEREFSMMSCLHTTPQIENGFMVCPLCGERAETKFRDDGTSYLDF